MRAASANGTSVAFNFSTTRMARHSWVAALGLRLIHALGLA